MLLKRYMRCAHANLLQYTRSRFLQASHLVPVPGIIFTQHRTMKRKATSLESKSPKKQAVQAPDYCDVEPRRDESGILWPAPSVDMDAARAFIKECAFSGSKTLLVPDKDADGLTSGLILYRTLTTLGLNPSQISIHHVSKGSSIHDATERLSMSSHAPKYIIVLDQGSRPGPPVVDDPDTKSLIIDHHLSDTFPSNAWVVSACHFPPVATSSLLAYELCKTLHPSLEESTAWLACVGTHGDLGTTLKWLPPFPDMSATFKTHSKKAINDAVALLNAPRRTANFDVSSAWAALLSASGPKAILQSPRLQEARAEINVEVERNAHAAPKFSKDGKVAVLRIHSAAQVHPVIATRWAGHLKSKALEIVMVANDGYLPGMVNFSCRIARCTKSREGAEPVNIIESLKSAAALSEDGLVDRLGESFARGHKEASGGIVPTKEFEELMGLLEVGVRPEKTAGEKSSPRKVGQKNNLMNYFAKA